jgi:hypothetical protein
MLSEALKQQYPDIKFSPDDEPGTVTLIDDGTGARIQHWNRPEPKPNEDDVLAAFDESAYVRQTKIAEAYRLCKQKLDALSTGYAQSEIATWPMMRAEVLQYNTGGTIGSVMQSVIALGRHTAQTLAAALTPKITYEAACLKNRELHVTVLLGYQTLDNIQNHKTDTGWPAAI